MKKDIHPEYNTNAKVICACGHSFITGSTVKELHIEICSNCHPFFTGKDILVDTAGRVDRFKKRVGKKTEAAKLRKGKKVKKAIHEEESFLLVDFFELSEFDIELGDQLLAFPEDILKTIIPFFKQNPLQSYSKNASFQVFCKIAKLVKSGAHFTEKGISKIRELKSTMNRKTVGLA